VNPGLNARRQSTFLSAVCNLEVEEEGDDEDASSQKNDRWMDSESRPSESSKEAVALSTSTSGPMKTSCKGPSRNPSNSWKSEGNMHGRKNQVKRRKERRERHREEGW